MEIERWKPSQVTKVEGRNLPFDALARACGIDTRNRQQVGRLTKALKDIRGYFAEEVGTPSDLHVTPARWEHGLALAIESRVQLYRRRFPRAECTPTAISAWWHQLAAQAVIDTRAAAVTRSALDMMFGRRTSDEA